jgi:phosphoglycolate phosphatase-like HAD superfamily hydrolase
MKRACGRPQAGREDGQRGGGAVEHPTHPTHLLVFDLDGTVLDGHGAGHRAMERAFLQVVGQPGEFNHLDFAGRTDPAMLHLAADRLGITIADEQWPRLLDAFVTALAETAGATRALPGVSTLLRRLAQNPDVGLAVGTGNVEAGAAIKLKAVGLADVFPVGGYGSDGESREAMLAVAVARTRRFYHADDAPLVTVGDTPRDVAAAHALGLRCIAVATGRYAQPDLEAAGADAALPSLEDAAGFYRVVSRLSGRDLSD